MTLSYRKCLRRAAVALLGLVAVPASHADTYVNFNQVPYVAARDAVSLAAFQALFNVTAHVSTVQLMVMGDSQEVTIYPPDANVSQQRYYIPQLSAGFSQTYGNTPVTTLSRPGVDYGAGASQPAEFLVAGRTTTTSTRISSTDTLPGLLPASVNSGQSTTALLSTDGQHTAASLPSANYFATNYNGGSGSVTAEVFVATNSTSGGLTYTARPTSSNTVNASASATASGTVFTGAALTSGTPSVQKATVTLPYSAGNPFMQVTLSGTDPSPPADVIGVRFVSSNPAGVSVQDVAAPGGSTSDLASALNGSSLVASTVNALAPDVVMLHTGANDATSGMSPDQFKAQQRALIAALRTATGNPNLKVILASDPERANLNEFTQPNFDQYVAAQWDIVKGDSIAAGDPNVLLLNSLRLTNDAGWTSATVNDYTLDGTHPNATGAALLANLEIAALTPEPATGALVLGGMAILARRRRR